MKNKTLAQVLTEKRNAMVHSVWEGLCDKRIAFFCGQQAPGHPWYQVIRISETCKEAIEIDFLPTARVADNLAITMNFS